MSAWTLSYLFLLHFIADFLLQSRKMGKEKSEKLNVLMQHLGIQLSVVFLGLLLVLPIRDAWSIAFANAAFHGVVDWNIWRLYKLSVHKRLDKSLGVNELLLFDRQKGEWMYWNDHWFYATIGLDQLLHIVTLTLIYGAIA